MDKPVRSGENGLNKPESSMWGHPAMPYVLLVLTTVALASAFDLSSKQAIAVALGLMFARRRP